MLFANSPTDVAVPDSPITKFFDDDKQHVPEAVTRIAFLLGDEPYEFIDWSTHDSAKNEYVVITETRIIIATTEPMPEENWDPATRHNRHAVIAAWVIPRSRLSGVQTGGHASDWMPLAFPEGKEGISPPANQSRQARTYTLIFEGYDPITLPVDASNPHVKQEERDTIAKKLARTLK